MKKIEAFCDVCGKQFPDDLQEFSQFTGAIIKFDAKMNSNQLRFSADYCDDCTKHILEFIETLHAEFSNTSGMAKTTEQGGSDSGA